MKYCAFFLVNLFRWCYKVRVFFGRYVLLHTNIHICTCVYIALSLKWKLRPKRSKKNTFLFLFIWFRLFSFCFPLCIRNTIQKKIVLQLLLRHLPRSHWHCWKIYWDWKKLNLELKTGIPCINFARRCISK